MEFPVLIEPHPPGFRAVTGAPLHLAAEGATADDAMASLQQLVNAKLQAGGQIRTLTITDIEAIRKASEGLRKNPHFEDFLRDIEEYRQIHNAVPDEN